MGPERCVQGGVFKGAGGGYSYNSRGNIFYPLRMYIYIFIIFNKKYVDVNSSTKTGWSINLAVANSETSTDQILNKFANYSETTINQI